MNELRLAVRISLIYAVVGCLWILASDWVSFSLSGLVPAYWSETVKGLGFVVTTAALLFWLIRRSARLLLESEQRFRLLIENAPDAVMIEAQGRIVYVNQTLLRLVGVEHGYDVIGRDIDGLIQGAALKAIRQRLTQVEQLKVPLKAQDISFQRPDGRTVLCEVSAVPVKFGEEEGALIFIRDTTERTKFAEKRLSDQKMESIRRLAGGLAHDLNNLLQVINGYTELSCEKVAEGDELRGHLEQIRISGRRAMELVERLLAFSRSKDPNEKWDVLSGTQIIPRRELPQPPGNQAAAVPQREPAPAPEEHVRAASASADKPAAGGGTVLIAEDDDMVRNLTARILKRAGYAVIEACDGDEALQLFQENARQVGVVLLDVVMPHLDGFQTYDRIREIDSHVPILFASGYSAIDTPSNVTLEPGVNLLQKPFDVDVLLAAVKRVMAGRTPARHA